MKNKVPLSEYPRMMMVRDSYLSLNGLWEYAIREDDETIPARFDGDILVPFSPETPLSGVKRRVKPNDVLFYRKRFTLPPDFKKQFVMLHFGAVDQIATVYLNGQKIAFNESGYHPFAIEISEELKADNELVLVIRDYSDTKYYSRGKQKIKRGQIWYTPQSGIYMPVWLESMPKEYIEKLKITPLYDKGAVEIIVFTNTKDKDAVIVFENKEYKVKTNKPYLLKVNDFISWTPENPHLYPFVVKYVDDEVSSYFAMRKISVATDKYGIKRIHLNNKVLFNTGLLDQGYYHEGYLTPPDDETVVYEIKVAKEMGFNVLRKHIKIEWERFYYHCDRLGMLVWQDFVNGGEPYNFVTVHVPAVLNIHFKDTNYKRFARQNERGRELFYAEAKRTIEHLYNYPCIILWTIFNEGWGQFDSHKLLPFVLKLDATRLIDVNSGWHDMGLGEFRSDHVYFRKYRFKKDKLDRCVILSEFGGYAHLIPGHYYGVANFGYRKYATKEALEKAIINLYENEIIPSVKKGLAAAIYTQLSDVEDELNGMLTYDRKVVKIDSKVMRELNRKLISE